MSRQRVAPVLLAMAGAILLAFLGLGAARASRAATEAALPPARGEQVAQPMAFNHGAHQVAEIECVYCHSGALSEAGAGMPRIQECVDCHAGIDNEGKEAAAIDAWAARGEEPPWQALFVLGKWNLFSHRAHADAKVACATCHGDIGTSVVPPPRRHAYEMAWCMDCHAERGASNDCLTCHK